MANSGDAYKITDQQMPPLSSPDIRQLYDLPGKNMLQSH
jgi:hypothetical protein